VTRCFIKKLYLNETSSHKIVCASANYILNFPKINSLSERRVVFFKLSHADFQTLIHNGASVTPASQALTTGISDKREDNNVEVDEYMRILRLVQGRIR
jgi:hypothetical protein